MLYLLNTPILTAYGLYRFSPLDMAQARELASQAFTSAVGHQGTADLLSVLLEKEIPMNRVGIQMEPGDEALIFRVKTRLPEGVVLSKEEIAKLDYEFGLLRRLE